MIGAPMEPILALRDEVLAAVTPLGAEECALDAALGRWLAEDAVARQASPPFDCSAMDGYALRADAPSAGGWHRVAATLFAGAPAVPSLAPGEAVRIFTGAPIPTGADVVVVQERAERDGDRVRFSGPRPAPGENVRRAGEDLAAGALAIGRGARIGARQAALLASVGCGRVRVTRRPRVRLLATGDEIAGGAVPDSNGPAVAALLGGCGAQVAVARVGDDPGRLADALREALASSDAIVTIGGVSVGERDLVPAAVVEVGGAVRVHGVPMKPGKPFLFAQAGGIPILGLPGSPSACLVAAEVFALPAVRRLGGSARPHRRTLRARLGEPVDGRAGRARFLWATLDAGGTVRPLGRDTAQLRGPALADALLRIPEDAARLEAGAEVEAWLLDDA
jgi:molybdopterin molybdotransferase